MDLLDLRTAWSDLDLATDVCIVGSGPAGLTIASELVPTGASILVVETGDVARDMTLEALGAMESIGAPRTFQHLNERLWVFGGASHAWTGRCARFDDEDFAHRSWVPFSGWPIGGETLAIYLERAASEIGITPHWDCRNSSVSATGVNGRLLGSVCYQFSQDRHRPRDFMRFGPRFLNTEAANVRVLLRATVTDLVLNESGSRLQSIAAANAVGKFARIRSRFTVLCCGGIENARLLLCSNKQMPAGVGNAHDIVGRFLMDHPRCTVGTFDADSISRLHGLFGPWKSGSRKRRYVFARGLRPSPELQRENALLNCAVWLDESRAPDDPLDAAKRLIRGPRSEITGDAWAVLSQPRQLLRGLEDVLQDRAVTHKLDAAGLLCSAEQRPDPDSRVRLAGALDRLGLPLVQVDWRVSEHEKASVAKLSRVIAEEFRRLNLPGLRLAPWINNHRHDEANFADAAHPTGTTRMGSDPRESVVDENCQVHGIHGLFVAGSSVFPTAGHANPTLMIVALATRLADFLKDKLRRDSGVVLQGGKNMSERFVRGRPVRIAAAAEPTAAMASLRGAEVVVTGATGFIGGRLVEKLLEEGALVTCPVRRGASSGRLEGLPVSLYPVDLTNGEAVATMLKGVNAVFHCAYDWQSEAWNVPAIRALVAGCLTQQVRRLVHVSTFSVYEPLADGDCTEDSPLTIASSGYAGNKLRLEDEVLRAVLERNLRATILQPTIVYGPYSRPWTIDPADMLLSGTVVLPGQGEGFCNALFVDDLADALLLAATREEAIGQRFLVSGPEVISWRRFYETVAAAVGAPGPAYRSAQAIARSNVSLVGRLRRIVHPALLARRAIRLSRTGTAIEGGLRLLRPALRARVNAHLFGPTTRRPGHFHLPNLGQLDFFSAQSSVDIGKIHHLLGYTPRWGWDAGMGATVAFLAQHGRHQSGL